MHNKTKKAKKTKAISDDFIIKEVPFLSALIIRMFFKYKLNIFISPPFQLMLSLPQVEACAVGLHEGSRLLAFVVASASDHQKAASPSLSVHQRAEQTPSSLPSSVKHPPEESAGADGDLKKLVQSQLSLLLPAHSVPDTLVLVPALCLTAHGEY